MKFEKELSEKKENSRYRIILGIIAILLATTKLIAIFIENENLDFSDWFFIVFFALYGISCLIEGCTPSKRKAYVLIDDTAFRLKTSMSREEQIINWDDIQSINYKLNKLYFKRTDNEELVLDLSEMMYDTKREIKNVVNQVAKDKNILSTVKV